MKIKASELSGWQLGWAVAKAEDLQIRLLNNETEMILPNGDWWYPAEAWNQAGSIIEREGIDLKRITDSLWEAEINANDYHNRKNGPTPLIAAMRCYVAHKLGEEIEVPEELMEV